MTMITCVALSYVHQQVELVKLSYSIGYKEKKLKESLDRNASLSYNIENLEDPLRLEEVLLAKNINITMPKRANIVRTVSGSELANLDGQKTQESLRVIGLKKGMEFLRFLDIFSSKAEAQTRTR